MKTKPLHMKKVYLLLLIAIPLLAMAQPPVPQRGMRGGLRGGMGMRGENRPINAENKNRLQALSVAFITKAVQLTPEEAEKFWPIYHKYSEDVRRATMDSTKKDVLEKQQEVLNIRKKYQKDFQKVLSPERTQKFFKAEQEFRNMVKNELEERRKNMPQRRRENNKMPR